MYYPILTSKWFRLFSVMYFMHIKWSKRNVCVRFVVVFFSLFFEVIATLCHFNVKCWHLHNRNTHFHNPSHSMAESNSFSTNHTPANDKYLTITPHHHLSYPPQCNNKWMEIKKQTHQRYWEKKKHKQNKTHNKIWRKTKEKFLKWINLDFCLVSSELWFLYT